MSEFTKGKRYANGAIVNRQRLAEELVNLRRSHDALLEALKHIAEECWDAMEGAGLPELQFYEHWYKIAKAAIAAAGKE